jgi:hypothetical protein
MAIVAALVLIALSVVLLTAPASSPLLIPAVGVALFAQAGAFLWARRRLVH